MTDEMPEVLVHLIESDLPPMKKCASFIREGILLGYLRKGRHIVERELVELLKISRTPVREAVRQLEKENLLVHYPHRGCVVVGFTAKDITEMYELRILLECFLMRKIVDAVDGETLEKLRRDEQERHLKSDGPDDVSENFHMRLLSLVRHRWLEHFLGQLEEYVTRFHVLSFLRQGRKDDAFHEHMDILDALVARDAVRAEEAMGKHLNASLSAFLAASPML